MVGYHKGIPNSSPQVSMKENSQNIDAHDEAFFLTYTTPARKTLQNIIHKISIRARVIQRSSQISKSLAPHKYRRILKMISKSHYFHRSSDIFRLPFLIIFPQLLARCSRTKAKTNHRAQGNCLFLYISDITTS